MTFTGDVIYQHNALKTKQAEIWNMILTFTYTVYKSKPAVFYHSASVVRRGDRPKSFLPAVSL